MSPLSRALQKLAADIAKREGKKSQARIGDIREIIGHLADITHLVPEEDLNTMKDPAHILFQLGERRAKKKPKN